MIQEREGGALNHSDKKHSHCGYFEGEANRIRNWVRRGMGGKRVKGESKVLGLRTRRMDSIFLRRRQL